METQFASEWEKERKIFDGLLQIYFEKKTQKTVQQKCHDKNLAIITSFHLFQICQKNFSMLVTIVRSTFRSGWFLHFSFSSSLECQITTRDKSRTRFFCLFFPFILRGVSRIERRIFQITAVVVSSTVSTPIDLRSKKFLSP